MKKFLFFVCLVFISCKKHSTPSGQASINIVQAIVGVQSIYVYFTAAPENFYLQQSPIGDLSSAEFSLASGPNTINVINTADTNSTLFEGNFNLSPNYIYSLYLAGQPPRVDTLFMMDQIPSYTDSISGVRFVNLASNVGAISVNIAGNPETQTEFSDIGYKQISAFKSYSAVSSIGGAYSFEIRQAASDSLLTTFIWNFTVQRNNTIVIAGNDLVGLNAFQVNNF